MLISIFYEAITPLYVYEVVLIHAEESDPRDILQPLPISKK